MNTRILTAVIVSLFVCQQLHAQQPNIEGTWEVVSCVAEGKYIENDSYLWRFEGNRIYILDGDGSGVVGGIFSVDESAMPAEIDFWCGACLSLIRTIGIYEMDDDVLTIYSRIFLDVQVQTRPDRFESTEDYPTMLLVLRRVTVEESE